MEDAATAEISRTQIWQWLRHGAAVHMDNGVQKPMSSALYNKIYDEIFEALKLEFGSEAFITGRFPEAAKLFTRTATSADLPEFLTLSAYDILETQ